MAIILKANKVNLFVSSVLSVFWYYSPNVLNTPHICDISRLRVKVHLPAGSEKEIQIINEGLSFVHVQTVADEVGHYPCDRSVFL
jgi:hypothetical protein